MRVVVKSSDGNKWKTSVAAGFQRGGQSLGGTWEPLMEGGRACSPFHLVAGSL